MVQPLFMKFQPAVFKGHINALLTYNVSSMLTETRRTATVVCLPQWTITSSFIHSFHIICALAVSWERLFGSREPSECGNESAAEDRGGKKCAPTSELSSSWWVSTKTTLKDFAIALPRHKMKEQDICHHHHPPHWITQYTTQFTPSL